VAKSTEKAEKSDRSSPAATAEAPRPGSNGAFVREHVPQRAPDAARDSALSRAVQQIEKQFGKGAVMKMDHDKPVEIEGIPTGSLSLGHRARAAAACPKGRVL
jgi:recombination protein RecA